MMKTIKYGLLILFCCCATLSYSQVTSAFRESMLSPDTIAFALQALRDRVTQFKQAVKEHPEDERAWMQYAGGIQALKGVALLQSMKPTAEPTSGVDIQKEFDEMLEGMKRNIPNTATYAITRNGNLKPGEKRISFKDIIDKWPDAVMHYPSYLAVSLKDEKRLKDICVRWYQSGEFPSGLLNFAYNELASAEKDAIIFMGGCLDLYGAQMLQNAKDQFKDKKIVMYAFLSDFMYMDELTEELGIPNYKKEESDTIAFSSPEGFVDSYSREMKKQVEHIIQHTKRPVYFTITIDEFAKNVFKDSLHSEGLLMKYSPKPYDNLAVMRRNFEHTYLMDYLRESFYPATLASTSFDPKVMEMLRLYYVPAFRSLLQFYKASGDQTHYDELYLLLQSVVKNSKSCDEAVREQYLKSINF